MDTTLITCLETFILKPSLENANTLTSTLHAFFEIFREEDYNDHLISTFKTIVYIPHLFYELNDLILSGLLLKRHDDWIWDAWVANRVKRNDSSLTNGDSQVAIGALIRMRDLFIPEYVESMDSVSDHRDKYHGSLVWLIQTFEEWIKSPLMQPVSLLPIMSQTPAYALTYHNENNVQLMKLQARLYSLILKHMFSLSSLELVPHIPRRKSKKTSHRPHKVGFVSRSFAGHSVGKISVGLMERLNAKYPDKVHIYVYMSACNPADIIANQVVAAAKKVVVPNPNTLAQWVDCIMADKLDSIIFLDPIMDINIYFLACFRIAPVQISTWGHPDTTGLPYIDFYISSQTFEVPNAQHHYTEKLVCMKSLSFYYKHIDVMFNSTFVKSVKETDVYALRGRFGIPTNKDLCVYGLTGTAFKIYPVMDDIICHLIKGNQNAVVVLIECRKRQLFDRVFQRVTSALTDEEKHRVITVPHQNSVQSYLSLVRSFDAVLDTIPFGGCISIFETFFIGRCIVTMPTSKLYGRFTKGLYERMGIVEMIAKTPDEYIKIAENVGKDHAFRSRIESKIVNNIDMILEDEHAIDEWCSFLTSLPSRNT